MQMAASEPLKIECEYFLHCLKIRERPFPDGLNGVAVVEMLPKAQEAMRG